MDFPVGNIYETLYAVLEASDRIFEFWITASFAVVIATFFAASRMTKIMFVLISFMYAIVSANMAIRWSIATLKFRELQAALIEQGEVFPASLLVNTSGLLTITTFVIGTCGTLYFAWYTYRNQKRDAKAIAAPAD